MAACGRTHALVRTSRAPRATTLQSTNPFPPTPGAGSPVQPPMTTSLIRSRRARYLIGAFLIGVAWASLPFLPGLLGAVVLSVFAAPSYRRLAPRIGTRRAALLITVALALLLAVPVALVMATVIRQAPAMLQQLLSSVAFDRLARLRVGPLDLGQQIAEAGQSVVAWGSGRAMTAAGGVSRAILNLFLAILGLYYLLPQGPVLWRRLRAYIPFSRTGADMLADRFTSITEAAVLGIAATAFTQGLTVGLGFWLVNLPNPVLWGVVTGFVSILPVLGSALVWVPGVVVLVLSDRPGAALALGVIGVVISSNVDNVVRPMIYRRVSGLHPMASLLGAFAGLELLGLLGLVLGPLAVAYCLELMRLYETEYAHLDHEHTDVTAD